MPNGPRVQERLATGVSCCLPITQFRATTGRWLQGPVLVSAAIAQRLIQLIADFKSSIQPDRQADACTPYEESESDVGPEVALGANLPGLLAVGERAPHQ